MSVSFSLILTTTTENGIGKDGKLPWNLPKELLYFSETTKNVENKDKQNAVIMGRLTWESIRRPLKNRYNIVLSKKQSKDVHICCSLDDALHYLSFTKKIEKVFVIGGAALYNEAMIHPNCKEIFLTVIYNHFECDVFWKGVDLELFKEDLEFTKDQEENGVKYSFKKYVKK
jgi:dihydrofolate reductase